MLEGLEISEISLGEAQSKDIFRLESDFYTAKSFRMTFSYSGEEIIELSQYGTSEELNEDGKGFPILRLNEFNSLFVGSPAKFCSKISQKTFDELRLKRGDVLICRTNGNPKLVGKAAIVPEDTYYAYASYLFKIRPKSTLINSATLAIFLNSKYGRLEIEKYSMASNQVNFSPAKFREINIPKLGSINEKVDSLVFTSFDFLKKSDHLYAEAEALLLKSLGLENFSPSSKNTNIKSFKDSFSTTGRLDAEYYQPKYEDYQNQVFSYQEGWSALEKVCDLKDKNYSPNDEKFYQYIELADINKSGGITGCSKELGKDLPSRARRKVNAGDVLISSIEGSLSSCAIVSKEFENSLCSTGFYVIKSDKINSETLLVLFKSDLTQNILKQSCSGTILTAINKDEFLKIPLPLIDPKTQSQISLLIQESFSLKSKSEKLLELAKKAVEMAIEESEEEAMKFINQ